MTHADFLAFLDVHPRILAHVSRARGVFLVLLSEVYQQSPTVQVVRTKMIYSVELTKSDADLLASSTNRLLFARRAAKKANQP